MWHRLGQEVGRNGLIDSDLRVGAPKVLCDPVIEGRPSKEDLFWVIRHGSTGPECLQDLHLCLDAGLGHLHRKIMLS